MLAWPDLPWRCWHICSCNCLYFVFLWSLFSWPHHCYYHHTAFSAWHYILITLPRTQTGYMNGRPVCRVSYNDISRLAQARWFVWDLFWSVWGADCNDNVIKINDLITAWTLQNCLSFQPFMSYNCVGHHCHSLPHCVSSETVPIISTLHHSATSQVLTT